MSDMLVLQDVNFWGTVHPTHCALPHLKRSRGKIFVNSSAAAMLAMPRMSFYNVCSLNLLPSLPRLHSTMNELKIRTCVP